MVPRRVAGGQAAGAGIPGTFWLVLGSIGAGLSGSDFVGERSRHRANRRKRALPHEKLRKLHDVADGWPRLIRELRGRRRVVVSFSLALWLTHLIQIWLFTVALSARVPFTVAASLSAVALMAAQVPFTIAGVGARDVVLVVLLASYMTPESAAAMGGADRRREISCLH